MYSSGVLRELQNTAAHYNYQFAVYGDPAYPQSNVLMKPMITGAFVTPAQRIYNHHGSRARVVVEWKFGDMQTYWPAVSMWKRLRILASPVPRYMIVAAFLTNCLNCHYPNRTEKYFDCRPPSLAAYFRIMNQDVSENLNNYGHYV